MSPPKVWEDGEFEEREAYLQRLRDDIGDDELDELYDDEIDDSFGDDQEDEDDRFLGYDEDDEPIWLDLHG